MVTALFSCADDIWTTAIVLAEKIAQGIADGAPEIVQAVSRCVLDIFRCLADWAPDFVDVGVQIQIVAQRGPCTNPKITLVGTGQFVRIKIGMKKGIESSSSSALRLKTQKILSRIPFRSIFGNGCKPFPMDHTVPEGRARGACCDTL